jgi:hypothetical protein
MVRCDVKSFYYIGALAGRLEIKTHNNVKKRDKAGCRGMTGVEVIFVIFSICGLFGAKPI